MASFLVLAFAEFSQSQKGKGRRRLEHSMCLVLENHSYLMMIDCIYGSFALNAITDVATDNI